MIKNSYLWLILLAIQSCSILDEEDNNLNDIPLQEQQWNWVYSIDEFNQNDTLATSDDLSHNVKIKKEQRKKAKSSIKYQFILDGDVIESHLINKIDYQNSTTTNNGYTGDTRIIYYGPGVGFEQFRIRDNPTIVGIYMYDFPYSSINGIRVKNYFELEK
jgi:hypothetical protein